MDFDRAATDLQALMFGGALGVLVGHFVRALY
jgi:hypothetical protein